MSHWKKRTLRWAVFAILALVLYLASFGPACWYDLHARSEPPPFSGVHGLIRATYWPVLVIANWSPDYLGRMVRGYANLGAPKGITVLLGLKSSDGGTDPTLIWVDAPVAQPLATPIKPMTAPTDKPTDSN